MGFGALMAIDHSARADHNRWLAIGFYLVLLGGATALAALVAWQARSVVEDAARRAVLVEAHRRNLALLFQDHHDIRSALSSAQLQLDMLDPSGTLTHSTRRGHRPPPWRGGIGARHVWIAAHPGPMTVRLSMRDDGPGFDPVSLETPLVPKRSREAAGRGNGLYLSHSAVEASGGALERKNPPEGGAEVVLDLLRST